MTKLESAKFIANNGGDCIGVEGAVNCEDCFIKDLEDDYGCNAYSLNKLAAKQYIAEYEQEDDYEPPSPKLAKAFIDKGMASKPEHKPLEELCERMLRLGGFADGTKDMKSSEIKKLLEPFFGKELIEKSVKSICGKDG